MARRELSPEGRDEVLTQIGDSYLDANSPLVERRVRALEGIALQLRQVIIALDVITVILVVGFGLILLA